jgi:hypothetical protein
MRLVIGGPTRDIVAARFAVNLANLVAYTQRWLGGAVWVRFTESTYIHVGRERVLEAAIRELDATHILWLDTDMTFPEHAAMQLARYDRSFVACNYVTRDGSSLPTAVRDGQRVEMTSDIGLEAVDGVGFGVALMQTDIVKGLARPWFRHGQTASGGDIGEDLMFCQAVRAAGHTIWIDRGLSHEIKHIGQHGYGFPAVAPVTVQR